MPTIIDGSTGVTFPAGGVGNPAGTVVGTTDTQTLTNKTISVSQLSGTTSEANGGTGTTTGYYGFKNRIINGAMMIDQRNAGAAVNTDNAYTVDRFTQRQVGGGVIAYQQSATATAGFINSMYINVTTADSSIAVGDNYWWGQRIEGLNVSDLAWGTANAATVTLSFWVRSSVTGTFGGGILNSAADRSYVFQYTINSANTWEQKSITIAGDTTGTWLTTNGTGINVQFDMGSGSNFNGTANSWNAGQYRRASGNVQLVGTLSNNMYITGVQLERGSTATSFDYRPYGTELALCQRYYEIFSGGSGRSNSTSNQSMAARFVVAKRAAPTVAIFGTGTLYDYNAITYTVSSVGTTAGISTAGIAFLQVNNASSGPGGGVVNNGTTACFSASVEL